MVLDSRGALAFVVNKQLNSLVGVCSEGCYTIDAPGSTSRSSELGAVGIFRRVWDKQPKYASALLQ